MQHERERAPEPLPDKPTLRQQAHARRNALREREQRSAQICAHVTELPLYRAARVIHCYLPIRSEVDTRPLIAHALSHGKRMVVPVVIRRSVVLAHSWLTSVDAAELIAGVFGTLQPRVLLPAAPGDWELNIVPMVAFDRQGYRLGYGKGFYDRLLGVAPTPTIGVAFAAQEIDEIPSEPHDRRLDWIVTEDEVLACRPGHRS
jgi:5-formyltetrahydrofolate cyclo-ligase